MNPSTETCFFLSLLYSGGDGNFVISSSLTGFTELHGGMAPMMEDGYGIFYSINKDRFKHFFFAHLPLSRFLLVCVTEQHYVSIFFACLFTKVDWWLANKNAILLCLRFIFTCRLVLYLYACAVENPEILGFCVSEIRA